MYIYIYIYICIYINTYIFHSSHIGIYFSNIVQTHRKAVKSKEEMSGCSELICFNGVALYAPHMHAHR